MKLLFLSKRRPMDRDLIESPYGRFFYLPRRLAERGHQVSIALLDYENGARLQRDAHGIRWLSSPVSSYLQTVNKAVSDTSPDWLIGFSDTWFGILAAHIARKHGLRSCIDAYDNYESYMPWAKPLHWFWRSALRQANLLSAAGPDLAALMRQGQDSKNCVVVPMAADPIGFVPRDKRECRQALQLPVDAPLVGYCGSLHRTRGAEVLFDAIPLLQAERPELRFYHSGRTFKDVPVPETMTSLGYIDSEDMPVLLNSMDVLVVINRESSFGRYSHPVKLYEAMSCRLPVVATRTRASEWILEGHSSSLVNPADPEALSAAVLLALKQPDSDYRSIPSWDSSCDLFERALYDAHDQPNAVSIDAPLGL